MNHDQTVGMCANSLAVRRQDRRHARPMYALPVRPIPLPLFHAAPHAPVSLPPRVTNGAGMFELMAARRRIAELEAELSAARDVASTDPLTGVLNRRGLDAAFRRELARARRSGAGLALALIDLDDFKRLNDVHGHQVGDRALVHLVDVLRAAMRPADMISRFGGEEFVLLLTETALADAVAALERFQRELAARPLAGDLIRLAFSAGIVMCGEAVSLDESIRRADAATYAAKRAGKNRVMAG